MTKVIIPYKSPDVDLPAENTDFHSKNFSETRSAILSKLRYIPGIAKIVSALNQDTVYKLVSVPEGGKLFTDSAGNIKGVFYKDGRIIEHARFQVIGPSLVKAAAIAGSQVLLISMAMQLDRIEKGISGIRNEFHINRKGEIFGGVKQFKQAMLVQDDDMRSSLIEGAIQILNPAIEKTILSLKTNIEEIPDAKTGFWDNWLHNKATVAEDKFKDAEESFIACLLGIRTLSECYATLNEPYAASATLVSNLTNLRTSGIEMAAQKARLVPAKANGFPEELWLSFLEEAPSLIDASKERHLLANGEFESFEIEFKPIELVGKVIT